ncbi:hypothetical protein BC834DRAFT_885253, partial [Gloeopeniophorella convolvens]
KPARAPHCVPGDTQVDGATPFMQVYMKETHTIVKSCTLTRMLAAVRRAYLNVHARPPPLARQTPYIKYLTNGERDQIDMEARTILARCADRVRDMETLEKRMGATIFSVL